MTAYRRLHTLLMVSSLCAPAAYAIDLRDYFPTPAGATWVYAFSEWSPTARCAGRRRITVAATAAGRLQLMTSPAPANCPAAALASQSAPAETLISSEAGYRLLARGGTTASYEWLPAMLVLPRRGELYQIYRSSGQVRPTASNEVPVGYQATLKLAAVEKLEVPAGSFPGTVRLQLSEVRRYPPPQATQVEVRTDRWLARGIGVLKTKTEVFMDGQLVQSTQFQLICSTLTDVQSVRCVRRGSRSE